MATKTPVLGSDSITNADRAARTIDHGPVETPRPPAGEEPSAVTRGLIAMSLAGVGLAAFVLGLASALFGVSLVPAPYFAADNFLAALFACLGGLAFLWSGYALNRRAVMTSSISAVVGVVCGFLSAILA